MEPAMFVQVIQGPVSDREPLQAALNRWYQELASGAAGWLGTTAGVTEDGVAIILARFQSEEAARRNSDRPEQGQWWSEAKKVFTAEPTFLDSTQATVDVNGDPDLAGFVQIIQGRVTDIARSRELMSQDSDEWAAFRPDILGSVGVEHEGGRYTTALYFPSEEDAREGERKEPPPKLRTLMEEMDKLNAEQPTFYDLKQPWLYSPQ
jgi:hypothetical protein